jgi:hypothetical protein
MPALHLAPSNQTTLRSSTPPCILLMFPRGAAHVLHPRLCCHMHTHTRTLMYCLAMSSSSCTMEAGCPSIGTLVRPALTSHQALE